MTDNTILGGLDPELMARVVSRREAVLATGRRAGLLALASMPVAFGVMAKAAFAQEGLPEEIVTALNFALTLEYLEADFYAAALAPGGVDVGAALPIFAQILRHENAHVLTLEQLLGVDNLLPRPTFDFTAGGAFPGATSNPATFFSLAQALEDLGVRAYKGQLTAVASQSQVVTTVMRLQSVEARHAAAIRQLSQSPGVKGWITGNDSAPASIAAVYAGEETTEQLGVDLTPFGSAEAASEAFDEPLTSEEVQAIIDPFIVAEEA